MTPDRNRREKILQRVSQLVETKFFDPDFDSAKWQAEVAARRDDILDSADSVAFEQAVHDLLQTLGKSHTAFFVDCVFVDTINHGRFIKVKPCDVPEVYTIQ